MISAAVIVRSYAQCESRAVALSWYPACTHAHLLRCSLWFESLQGIIRSFRQAAQLAVGRVRELAVDIGGKDVEVGVASAVCCCNCLGVLGCAALATD